MGSWSGRHGQSFGWRGQAEGLDSGRPEAGEWDCLGIVVGLRSSRAKNERGAGVMMASEFITPFRSSFNGIVYTPY